MNYRSIAIAELVSFAKENPDYTLGQILYSFLREGNSGCKKIPEIMDISDEDMYSMIENAKEKEKPE
jgi:hypothetical protein